MYSEPVHKTPSTPGLTLDAELSPMFGVEVQRVTEAAVLDHVLEASGLGHGGTVVSVNLDTLRQAYQSGETREILQRGDVRIADGMPILWAGRLAGTPFPERVAGSTLVPNLARRAADRGLSVYLLGGNEGTAERAAAKLKLENPALVVAGTDFPPFGFEHSEVALATIKERLTAAAPDIVFVALPFPKQERLIAELRSVAPSAWFVSCGITFSFIAGDVRRAPVWMQRYGLEWLHRLTQEPKKLARRYFIDDAPFLVRLIVAARRSGRARASTSPSAT